MIDQMILSFLDDGIARHREIELLHNEGLRSAKLVEKSLVGKRCKDAEGKLYEIRDVRYGWSGYIRASGYKIVAGDKRGKYGRWDIGILTSKSFEL